jgi:large subunit ribosomal protein L22
MEARAVRKYIHGSPRKMRIIVNEVRGMKVSDALSQLHFMPQSAARWVESTIHSAVHNLIDRAAEERVDEDEIVIRTIAVDSAPMIKRFRPAPRGRAHRIRKRMSHLTVIVGSPAESEGESATSDE